ncbi:phage integrase SAM-like domain and Arm DNA-binding domain-containing protein [Maribacter litopenaei]|uniref:Phage integrase SAM-like domain and Arm DNA-binding domain-containing protein n=1 Tax=Maribacter litopenaei TaxID=2976127 RepID=A0ABY5YBE7_9FLAO|nr:phage integrase SAM-like domain and Arm DNA-binding domain-containing protein [Maribacter litopenaei]UWX56239.1 phage integrase SAM-like domain and Arm DNA-binding domain-containing protein [Maribacter litopenaei]
MATINIVLRKNYSKSDGTCPLALRITKNRKSRFIYTGEYVLPKHWDDNKKIIKKIHPNSARLNNMLKKKISEAHEIALEAESKKQDSSAKYISKKITGEDQQDFFSVSKIYLSNLFKKKKYNQHYNQERRIRIFRKFVGSDKLSFQDLNVSLLNRFDSFLIHERGVSPRTSVNYLMLIRTIYNFARREFDIDYKIYPFGKGKIQIKFPSPKKLDSIVKKLFFRNHK